MILLVQLLVGLSAAAAVYAYGSREILRRTQAGEDNEVVESAPTKGNGERQVVVVQLGWGGATLRMMRRQVETYNEMGIHTMVYIAPMAGNITATLDLRPAQDIMRRIEDMKHKQQVDVYFHVYSNNGMLSLATFQHLWKQHKHVGVQNIVRGFIFDSTPTVYTGLMLHLTPVLLSFAVVPVMRKSANMFHPFWTPVCMLLLPIMRRTPKPHEISLNHAASHAARGLNLNVPQLYLYSTKDFLVPSYKVEEFMSAEKIRGRTIHSRRWTDTAHVAHFRKYPEEYTALVADFMTNTGAAPLAG